MLSQPIGTGQAFNRSRMVFLATELRLASTHLTRLRGLMFTDPEEFQSGQGLWIVPSHGVHTFAMRFPIDVAYLDENAVVIHLEHGLQPWRVAPVRARAASVLELPEETLKKTQTGIGDQIEIEVQRAMVQIPEASTA